MQWLLERPAGVRSTGLTVVISWPAVRPVLVCGSVLESLPVGQIFTIQDAAGVLADIAPLF